MNKEKLREEFKQQASFHSSMIGQLSDYELDKITTWWLNKLLEHDRELMKIAEETYVDGADWAEWGMSDEDARENFKKEFAEKAQSLLALDEESK